ncbi:Asp-tRNA(Asn)/Glu-tRNA(Gln) amidotransferase subunit GatA, partial [Candidatus Woesearchaeota archaeon]|nr:Asp-tRNA(Asn)/Glu-tRNA(Gln) amidotransferase subunit GatA [Candidatus Woesearchaeota archaeon]
VEKAIEEAKKISSEYNYFNAFDETALEQAKIVDKKVRKGVAGKLAGVLISVKDCICVNGVESTAGSAILKGYKPLFDATVVERCRAEDAIILGKTSQDEFGFGGFSTNVGKNFKTPLNPLDKTRSCGGSSGGAGGITQKADFPHLAIAESTGGSIVNPAAFCDVVGLCPTYGRVSRYGLIDYANSLDKIGTMAKNTEDAALLYEVIAGHDAKDSTSVASKPESSKLNTNIKGLRIGLVGEAFDEGVDGRIAGRVEDAVKKLECAGAKITRVSLPLTFRYGIPTYYVLAMSEASTNLAKYCGVRYGATLEMNESFNEFFSNVRTQFFGSEAKRRIILGTFARMAGYRDAYYLKAAAVRTKIVQEYKKAFAECDVLVTPTMPVFPPTFEHIEKLTPLQNYMMDILTVGPNLAGLPHISLPCEKINGLPVGMQLIGNHFEEFELINTAHAYETNK